MNESIFQAVLRQLESSKGRWPEVASGSGVSIRTIQKIASGEIEDPGVSHIEKLYSYFNSPTAQLDQRSTH